MKATAHRPKFDRVQEHQNPFNTDLIRCLQWLCLRKTPILEIRYLNCQFMPIIRIPFGITAWTLGGDRIGIFFEDGQRYYKYQTIVQGCRVQWTVASNQLPPFH